MTDTDTTPQPVDYSQRRRDRAVERTHARRQGFPVAVLVGGLCVILLLGAVEVVASWDRVHPGVTVAGIHVGGMKSAAAVSALEAALPEKVSQPIVMNHDETSWKITPSEIGLTFNYPAMAADAMSVGRDGGAFAALFDRVGAWFGASDLPARPQTDAALLSAVWDKVAKTTDVPPIDASVEINGTDVSVVPGKNGTGLNREKAERLVLTAMLSTRRTVAAPVESVPVTISDTEAEAAKAVALRMLAGPAQVTFDEKSWQFAPKDIALWLAFRRSDMSAESSVDSSATLPAASEEVTLVAFVSAKRTAGTVTKAVGTKVGRPAKNARFSTSNGRVTIIPSQEGVGPDLERLASELTAALTDEASSRTVELHTARAEPALTTDEARAMGIKERIARFTTTYSASNRSRVNNIHLLGDSLDGKLIRPGGTFSFNGAIGERTAAKGYQEANAIVNGKLVPQLGGGICQVGTTLFNTVFESGFPVMDRRNHSFYISHYPKGRDATVSWGGPDLKFKNDTENWVLISVDYTSSSITIALYGADPGYEIESHTSDWRNIKAFGTEEIKDPTMYVGSKIVEDEGITGRTITVTRTVQKDGEVLRTDTFISVYKPKVQVVRVGTKPKPVSRPATTTPTR